MEDNSYLGLISVREEFFYPDSALMTLPRSVRIAMPLNAKPGIQLRQTMHRMFGFIVMIFPRSSLI